MGNIVRSTVSPLAAAVFPGHHDVFTAPTTETKGVHLRLAENLIFVALLVCSSFLLAQRTNAADFIMFDVPGSACAALFPQCTTAVAISPEGVITGSYADANAAIHSYLRSSDGAFITFDPQGSVCPSSVSPQRIESRTCSSPSGINQAGTISGIYCDTVACHGFLRASNGTITTFDPPGSMSISAVSGPNPSGAVTGSYIDTNHIVHGFLRAADGTFGTFDPQGSITTVPTSIDPQGAIAGSYTNINSGTHGFLRASDGAITSFDAPGSIATSPSDINSAGVITGSYLGGDLLHHYGFLRSPDSIFITFTAADSAIQTIPKAINRAGVITGFYQTGETLHGFVRGMDGNIVKFDPLGSVSTIPQGIDPTGTITGYYVDSGNLKHGFIRVP